MHQLALYVARIIKKLKTLRKLNIRQSVEFFRCPTYYYFFIFCFQILEIKKKTICSFMKCWKLTFDHPDRMNRCWALTENQSIRLVGVLCNDMAPSYIKLRLIRIIRKSSNQSEVYSFLSLMYIGAIDINRR